MKEPEGEDGERSIGLVAFVIVHGRAPEVVAEDVPISGVLGRDVSVELNGIEIVVDQFAVDRVDVGPAAHQQRQPVQPLFIHRQFCCKRIGIICRIEGIEPTEEELAKQL